MNQYILILIWILIMGIFYGTRRTNDIENTGSDVISPPSILFRICHSHNSISLKNKYVPM